MLTIGTRLGPYEITGSLGAGGMGEVYRARDTTLNRDVAIKVLPDLFAADAERLARFEREAQVLASLNHPNIAHVYGVEQRALVMELVEGEDLAQRLSHGAIPLDEALPIAAQIADALEAAHERAIVHRDLKPANIKLRPDGTVKVLDFGLAKAMSADGIATTADARNSPTITNPFAISQLGVILGTAAYMGPEQARGRAVDKRADIWAFGCVLYEVLTGRRAFPGDDATETVAAIVRAEPEWSALPAETPRAIRELLRRCLEKDPKQRLRDIGEARLVLASPGGGAPVTAPPSATHPARWIVLATVAALGGLAIGAWIAPRVRSARAGDLPRLHVGIAVEGPVARDFVAVLSPDGQKIAFVTDAGVWIRRLSESAPKKVYEDNLTVRQLFWSPDSAWIGMATADALLKIPIEGGAPVRIADLGGVPGPFSPNAGAAAWTADDRILFVSGFSGLFEVSARGGEPRLLVPVKADEDFHGAALLPGGAILTAVHRGSQIDTYEALQNGRRTVVYHVEGQRLGSPVYSTTGHLVFARLPADAGMWALPFDAMTVKVTGDPFVVLARGEQPSVSADGRILLAAPYVSPPPARLSLIGRAAKEERPVGPQHNTTRLPFAALSPDGRRLVASVTDGPDANLWVYGVGTPEAIQVTSGQPIASGAWWPDGRQLLVVTGSPWCLSGDCFTIGVTRADGGDIRPLARGWSPDVSPDHRTLVYSARGQGTEWDLVTQPLADGARPRPFQGGRGWQYAARFSPDGRYIAYVSTESGRDEVYVAKFPTGGKWRVSTTGGFWPHWRGDASRLYYARGSAIVEVPVSAGDTFTFGPSVEVLPAGTVGLNGFGWPYAFDVSPDGARFLVFRPTSNPARPVMELIQNWMAAFTKR